MKRLLFTLFFITALLYSSTVSCLGPSISKHTAAWDANTETDLAGYYLYWKPIDGIFSNTDRVMVVKSATPTFNLNGLNLPAGVYVIAVSAYDTEGNESALSNEVTWDASYPDAPKSIQIK